MVWEWIENTTQDALQPIYGDSSFLFDMVVVFLISLSSLVIILKLFKSDDNKFARILISAFLITLIERIFVRRWSSVTHIVFVSETVTFFAKWIIYGGCGLYIVKWRHFYYSYLKALTPWILTAILVYVVNRLIGFIIICSII